MTFDDGQKIEVSALSRNSTHTGVTVQVEIYRAADSDDGWTLEVIDADDNSLVWEDPFDTEAEAWAEFERAVEDDGITMLIGPPSDEIH